MSSWITPLAVQEHLPFYWHLPILIVVVSIVYSATRFDNWGAILHEAWWWGLRMTSFLFAVAIVLYVVALFFT